VSRILIVDDEPALLDALARLPDDEAYSVRAAPDGQVALEVIAAKPPDLLITDVMTPGLGSWALLAQVRERTTGLPAIVISAVDRKHAARYRVAIERRVAQIRERRGFAADPMQSRSVEATTSVRIAEPAMIGTRQLALPL